MKTIGIVAEYNPFHHGHAWQIRESRRLAGEEPEHCPDAEELRTAALPGQQKDTAVIVVMSGDFVQRGEAAVFSKYARAEAACRSGADLVVELPLPWAVSSAEGFACGAVSLLASLGAETLSFGSESAEKLPEMVETAALLSDPAFTEEVKQRLRADPARSFAAARQTCAEERTGKQLSFMQQPNNILGLEYLKAIRTMALPITPLAVARKGAGHDEAGENAVPSASELRLRLCRGDEIGAFTTQEAAEVFQREKAAGRIAADRERYELLMLSRLRFLQEEDFLCLPDAGDGLGLRLYHAVQGEQSFEGILAAASTRRCPLARVRRMCVCAALGLRAGDRKGLPPYARVLAFNDKGRELLHDASEKRETDPGNLIGTIPLIIKPAHVRRLDTIAQHVFELGVRAHDFHSLLYPGNGKESCGEDWRRTPAIC